jgi:phospholipid/cholesterol/gamma-HCH transport system substrate-binding protein
MKNEITHNIKLGIFVLFGGLLLIFGLYVIGKNKNMFGKTFRLVSVFYDVNGLTVGNNVRYSGIDVGTVEKIEIINDSAVSIEMLIDDKVKKFIRKNSIASIGTDGLMGNKIVNITPGSPEVRLVQDNDEINSLRTVDTENMLRTLELTNSNVAIISSNLKEITENVNKSKGTLYRVLMDTTLAKNVEFTLQKIQLVSTNLVQTSSQLSVIVNDVGHGKGTIGLLLNDTTLPNDLRLAVRKVKEGSEQFSTITNDVADVLKQINSGNGVMHSLLKDSVMAENLRTSLTNIDSASRKLDDNLEALKHSILLRGYFKRLGKAKK